MPFSSIQASTAREPTDCRRPALADTCAEMLGQQLPNFFRLYLNSFVVQTCFCLSKYVQTTWSEQTTSVSGFQTFLANSFDEALSGAIKLARYTRNLQERSPAGLVIDAGDRLGTFASMSMASGGTIEFVPKLVVVKDAELQLVDLGRSGERFGFIVLVGSVDSMMQVDALRALVRDQAPLIITCLDRASLAACRSGASGLLGELAPDIVIFDESFVDHQVPFAAFTARKRLFHAWNRPRLSAFHSTTFQPNTISSLHFLKCLEQGDPEFHATIAADLEWIGRDPTRCAALLSELYSPFIGKASATLGFDTPELRAAGHYVFRGEHKVFDGIAGIACSMRGHNPTTYLDDLQNLDDVADCQQAVAERLRDLTNLDHVLPAVSGATAVENALRVGLATQFPKQYVLAFKGGFGGKTLFSLTGTAKSFYKEHIDPLYEKVIYVDPFSSTALADLESALKTHPVGIVQLELIQAVGGVRCIPATVLRWLQEHRESLGYLLFVDEVQTGMYRTGPFTMSETMNLAPDILTLGKGTSDMMFPFALTLYSSSVQRRLDRMQPQLVQEIHDRYHYEFGYKSVLSTLQRAGKGHVSQRVMEAGELFSRLLQERLASCKVVREVRVHGLLIAIELDKNRWPQRWLGNRLPLLYVLDMVRNKAFPLIIGYCQYELNVLKLTPPLSITQVEIRQVCDTIEAALKKPWYKLCSAAVLALVKSGVRQSRQKGNV